MDTPTAQESHPLDVAAKVIGTNQGGLAALLGVTKGAISQWRSNGIPTDRCTQIELLAAGLIACEGLRPDMRWHRVPDAAWPHPDGRPLIDVAAVQPQALAASSHAG